MADNTQNAATIGQPQQPPKKKTISYYTDLIGKALDKEFDYSEKHPWTWAVQPALGWRALYKNNEKEILEFLELNPEMTEEEAKQYLANQYYSENDVPGSQGRVYQRYIEQGNPQAQAATNSTAQGTTQQTPTTSSTTTAAKPATATAATTQTTSKKPLDQIADESEATLRRGAPGGASPGVDNTPDNSTTPETPTTDPTKTTTTTDTSTGTGRGNFTTWRNPYGQLSYGDLSFKKPEQPKKRFDLDWTHIFDGAGALNSMGNTYRNWLIADKAEQPILRDPVEHLHSVYGDYFARVQGLQNAGNILSTASKPVTSDAAHAQASMLQGQISANDAIAQNNQLYNQKVDQTSEVAWQQGKENKNVRHDTAMYNRDAQYKSDYNRADLKQQRNTYMSKEIANLIEAWSKDYQDHRQARLAYQDMADQEFSQYKGINNILNNQKGISPEVATAVRSYMTNPYLFSDWFSKTTDDAKKQEALSIIQQGSTEGHKSFYRGKGVVFPEDENRKGRRTTTVTTYAKQGTSLQTAMLKKRSKDVDRFTKTMEESNKRVQKAVFKSIDRMFQAPAFRAKLQHGGGLVSFNSNIVRTPSSTITPPIWFGKDASGSSKKDSGLATKDILTLLKDVKTLESDQNLLTKALSNIAVSQNQGIASSSSLEASIVNFMGEVNKAKKNYDMFEKGRDSLIANQGINEVYIDSNGFVMVEDPEKGFAKVRPDEIDGKRLVTFAEALNYRDTNPSAAFDTNILYDAQAGIGVKSLLDKMSTLTTNLGSDSDIVKSIGRFDDKGNFTGDPSLLKDLISKLNSQGQPLTLNNIVEGMQSLETGEDSNYDRISDAFEGLYNSMTTQEQSLVYIKSKQKGCTPSEYLLSLILPKLKTNKKWEHNQTTDHSKEEKNKQDELYKQSPMEIDIFTKNNNYKTGTIAIGDHSVDGSSGKASLNATVKYGNLYSSDKLVTKEKLKGEDLLTTDLVNHADMNQMSFNGARIVNPSKISLNNTQWQLAILPTTTNSSGMVVPDFNAWTAINEGEKKLKSVGGAVNKKGEKFTLEDLNNFNPEEYDQDQLNILTSCFGKYLNTPMSQFYMLPGYASDLAFDTNEDVPAIGRFVKERDAQLNAYLENINNGVTNKEFRVSGSDIGNFYEGSIFIPATHKYITTNDKLGVNAVHRMENEISENTRQGKIKPQKNIINQ